MEMTKVKSIAQIAHHRNGISGRSFYAVLFTCKDNGLMVAAVFPSCEDDEGLSVFNEAEPEIAVFQLDGLMNETVAFGENSWRGDFYAGELFAAIREHERNQ